MESIHIGIGYDEAIEGKKDLLTMQAEFLKSIKRARNFKQLRKEEEKSDDEIRKNLREISLLLGRISQEMPQEHMPKIKTGNKEEKQKVARGIEQELQEIQRKLQALG